ncbi:MAG: hypothetical protein LBQ40_02190 [Clostridiales bacterium]|nr:hypothetical protein [Clostridiales bacterium]
MKKIPPWLSFAAFALSCFFADFFVLRVSAYSLPFDAAAAELLPSFETLGVYAYMAVQALINAVFIYFIFRLILTRQALVFGVVADKKTAGLYLEFFITAANIVAGLFGLLFLAYPYIFINYITIIKFFIVTVGYIFLAYFFTREFVPGKRAKRFFFGLASMYFGINITYTVFAFITGGFLL